MDLREGQGVGDGASRTEPPGEAGDGAAPATANGAGAGAPVIAAPAEQEGGGRRRRLLALGAIVVALAAIAAVLLLTLGGSSKPAAATGVPTGETTATITRRTLTESATVEGTLGYGASLELYDRLAGTYTWLPSVGAVIGRGGTLFRLDDKPVVLMYGTVPAYRTMKEGISSGPDVVQLNENLIALGYDPYGAISDYEDFSAATAAAVKRWQHAEGLSETGEVELGRVVFAPSARRVTDVHVTLGQDPEAAEPSGKSGEPESKPSTKPSHSSHPSHHKRSSHPKRSSRPKHASHPKHSSHPSDSGKPSSSDDPSGESGEGAAGAGEVVLTTTSTQQLVELKVKAEQQGLAHVGRSVSVSLPGGTTARGRIISVGTVASAASGSGSKESEKGGGNENSESPTVTVTVALDHPVAHLDEAPVSVELISAVRRDVLTVPAPALVATAGGGYAIEVLSEGHREALPVTPGMFANSYVQVEGPGVREGLTVIEPE